MRIKPTTIPISDFIPLRLAIPFFCELFEGGEHFLKRNSPALKVFGNLPLARLYVPSEDVYAKLLICAQE
jgi:hypothetical protein